MRKKKVMLEENENFTKWLQVESLKSIGVVDNFKFLVNIRLGKELKTFKVIKKASNNFDVEIGGVRVISEEILAMTMTYGVKIKDISVQEQKKLYMERPD